jgi:hypothetical protein
MPGLGGWRHRLLGVFYDTYLAPWLGGWMRQGTQHASRDTSCGCCKTTQKYPIQEAFEDLSWEDDC